MSESVDLARAGRYLAGEMDLAERAEFEQWCAADGSRAAQVDALRALWAARARVALPRRDEDAAWATMAARVIGILPPPSAAPAVRRAPDIKHPHAWPRGVGVGVRVRPSPREVGLTAFAVIVIAVALGFSRLTGAGDVSQQVREFVTAPASHATVTLRDGTRLVLGPATRLHVPADFGRTTRVVALDGEALLAVVHDVQRPFTVQTAHALVRDVGTTFVVRAYAADPEARVAVADGTVALSGIELRTRDVAVVDGIGRVTVTRGVDVAPDFAWTQGSLVFKGTPLRDVVRELGRTFDLDVTIADSVLAGRRITSTFGVEPIDEVLDAVAQAAGGRYERTGRKVVIRRRRTAAEQEGPTVRRLVTTAQARARE